MAVTCVGDEKRQNPPPEKLDRAPRCRPEYRPECRPDRTSEDAYEGLTVVRRYRVDESPLPEAEKSRQRERVIEALTEVMGKSSRAEDGAAE